MSAGQSALGDVLFGKARGAVLALLYGRADESFYYRQITRLLGDVSAGTVQRELETLSQLGLITRSKVGKQVFYQANRKHPVFPELRTLVGKTVGAFHELREALAPLADRISFAFVYGSMARQEEGAESDIDLMVVGRVGLEDVIEHLSGLEMALGRSVNPTLYSVAEFKTKLASGNHFLASVMRGQMVFVMGDEIELRKLRAEQLDHERTDKP